MNIDNVSPELISQAENATYQWMNCDNNQIIAGQTGKTFTATENGSYAVIVTQNNCTDTSNCQIVDNIGVSKEELANQTSVTPNPGDGKFVVLSGVRMERIDIFDNLGRFIKRVEPNGLSTQVDLTLVNKGIYLFRIETIEGIFIKRVVKQ